VAEEGDFVEWANRIDPKLGFSYGWLESSMKRAMGIPRSGCGPSS
jgi:hypothetical protein